MKAYILLSIILLSLAALSSAIIMPAKAETLVFEMNDPIGDDNGPGTYVYPTNDVFQPGVFDLTKFQVIYNGTHVVFKVYVANLGDNPWNGPNGFCLQFPHIFVRTSDEDGNTSAFGLNVVVANDSAWHFALLLAPGWEENPVPQGQRAALYYANGTVVVQDGDFKVYANESENAIIAVVKADLLPNVDNIANWKYVVALAGYDGFGPMRVRTTSSDAEAEWNFGNASAEAVAVGVAPYVIDLLAPTAEDQYQMLTSYTVNLDNLTGTLAVVHGYTLQQVSAPVTEKTVFYMEDPMGDDNGPGTYVYPTNDVFQPGVFDLTGFKVVDAGDKVKFIVYVKNLGDNPWNGPNGFCLQFPHIFVRTTADLPVNNTSFGLNVVIAPDYAWHFALLLAPGWEEKPVPEGQKAALYYANRTVVVQDDDFKVYANETENAIIAEVSKKLLPDVEHIKEWRYVVALAGYDGFGPMRVRTVTSDPEAEWNFGNASAEAVAVGVAPYVIDLLAPTAEDQYKMLNSYTVNLDTFTGTLAVVYGVPEVTPTTTTTETTTAPATTVTETVTTTETVTETVTATTTQTVVQTTTATVTQTVEKTQTIEKTMTQTQTVTQTTTTTQKETVTETSTTTITVTDYTAAAGIGIVLLLVGIGIGFVIGKGRK